MQRSTRKSAIEIDVPEQLTLLTQRATVSKPVSLEHIPLLQHTGKAVEYACNLADLDPKQICPDVFPDTTACSRVMSGKREPRFGEAWRLNKLTGNRALSLYFAHIDGWDISHMRLRVDDKDRRIRQLEEQVIERDRAIQLIVDAAHKRK